MTKAKGDDRVGVRARERAVSNRQLPVARDDVITPPSNDPEAKRLEATGLTQDPTCGWGMGGIVDQ